jgi:hypothetical protein
LLLLSGQLTGAGSKPEGLRRIGADAQERGNNRLTAYIANLFTVLPCPERVTLE